MAFVEDLTLYFADFGVAATLAGVPVRGIFDAAGGAHGLGQGGGIVALEPRFTLPSADVPGAVFGATLAIGAAGYTVREHLPDGTGVSTLLLQAA